MKKYTKIINGIETICLQNKIIIEKDGLITHNPSEEMILEDGWIEYIEVFPEKTFEQYKQEKLYNLELHDNSSEVNECFINYEGIILSYWADKNERSVLKTAVQDCIAFGRDTYRLDLRDLNVSININCTMLLQMLAALEVYAIDCYNTTTDHIFNIKELTTQEELDAYDYKLNYPEKLTFTI